MIKIINQIIFLWFDEIATIQIMRFIKTLHPQIKITDWMNYLFYDCNVRYIHPNITLISGVSTFCLILEVISRQNSESLT